MHRISKRIMVAVFLSAEILSDLIKSPSFK